MTTPTTAAPYYDPEVKAALDAAPSLGTVSTSTLAKIRANRLAMNAQIVLSDGVERTDVIVPGPADNPELRLRVHRPVGATGLLPAVYWVHGGGYVLGSPEQDDQRFDRWCERFGIMGVAVQYRLAPETPYPGPLEDAYAGLRWIKTNGESIGIDTTKVGIGGASAGGGLAAGLALCVRDRGEFDIAYQLLIYPMIDDTRTTTTANWHEVPVWNPESNHFGWSSYLGSLFDTDDVPSWAAATRATDLAGLPPTYIMVGTLDGFCDEDIDYAARLNRAGVPVELHVYPGAPHGFEGFAPNTAVARQARKDINDWLGRMVGAS